MSLFSMVWIRRNEIIKRFPRSRLARLIKSGNIYKNDLISTDKKNWARFDEDPEFAEIFKEREAALANPVEYRGILVCPQCRQDYPHRANYLGIIGKEEGFWGWQLNLPVDSKRFKPFNCEQCGVLLKRTLGPGFPYLVVTVGFACIWLFSLWFNIMQDHEPSGFGFGMFYEGQYLDNPSMFFVVMMAVVGFLLPLATLEKSWQRLELAEYDKNPERIHHLIGASMIGLISMAVLCLGLYLNICKDLITFQIEPTFHHNTKTILRWTPFWKGPFYTVQAQGHLLNGEFSEAVDNFDRALELDQSHSYPFFYRGIAHYYLEQYDQAEFDLNMAIQIDTGRWEPDDLYKTLWIFMVKEKKEGSGRVYIQSLQDELKLDHWPDPLLLMLSGEIEPDRLLENPEARNRTQKCQAFFYTGIYYKNHKRYEDARTAFENVQQTKAEDCIEIHAAGFELERLKRDDSG